MTLSVEALKAMPKGTVFARGEMEDSPYGLNMTGSGKMLRWIAKRGDIHDWAIYTHWAINPWEYIAERGDKVRDPHNIKRLIPCDDDAFDMYRW